MNNKTWKINILENFDNLKTPKQIFNDYGHKLESDTNYMLTFNLYEDNEKLIFNCKIPNRNFIIEFFEIISEKITTYPCTFKNLLNNNIYKCKDNCSLINIIEKEINSDDIKESLNKIILFFYNSDEIKKLK